MEQGYSGMGGMVSSRGMGLGICTPGQMLDQLNTCSWI